MSEFTVHTIPGSPFARAVLATLEEKGARYRLDYEPPSESYLTKRGPFVDLVVKALADSGVKAALSTSGGTSDARFIKNYCPVIDLGLVGNTMHQIDEHVPLEDLKRLSAIYRRILQRYFETPPV